MYQMMVGQYHALLHLYYGANVGDTEITYRIISLDRGFCANPSEEGRSRTFSLDVLPQELTDPFTAQEYCMWEFAAKDRSEAIVKGVKLKGESNDYQPLSFCFVRI